MKIIYDGNNTKGSEPRDCFHEKYTYTKKDVSKGCADRKCPCRLWVNCSYYNCYRMRVNKDNMIEEIHEWYEVRFKGEEYLPDAIFNG